MVYVGSHSYLTTLFRQMLRNPVQVDGQIALYDAEELPLVGMKMRWGLLSAFNELRVNAAARVHETMKFELAVWWAWKIAY